MRISRLRILICGIALLCLPSGIEAQRISPSAEVSGDSTQPFEVQVSGFPIASNSASRPHSAIPDLGDVYVGGVLGGVTGGAAGLALGYGFARIVGCYTWTCFGPSAFGAAAGLTIGMPIGAHLANQRRGRFVRALLASSGVAAIGTMILSSNVVRYGGLLYSGSIIGISLLQLTATVWGETGEGPVW